jgi:hypothetical protein
VIVAIGECNEHRVSAAAIESATARNVDRSVVGQIRVERTAAAAVVNALAVDRTQVVVLGVGALLSAIR